MRKRDLIRIFGRAPVALANAVATVIVILGVKHFQEQSNWVLGSVAFVALSSLVQALYKIVIEYRITVYAGLRRGLQETATAGVVTLFDLPDLGPKVGMSIFLVRRIASRLYLRRALVRVTRVRITGAPPPTPRVVWTKGKGVIGLCWQNEDKVEAHTEAAWRPHLTCDRSTWRHVDPSIRLSLTYRDFKRIQRKYVGAIAVPIKDAEGYCIGCVCVDAPPGVPWASLNRDEVWNVLGDVSVVVSRLIAASSRSMYLPGGGL